PRDEAKAGRTSRESEEFRDQRRSMSIEPDSLAPPTDSASACALLTRQARAFHAAWDRGDQPPNPAEFVPTGPPALRRMVLVELVKLDLGYRLGKPELHKSL